MKNYLSKIKVRDVQGLGENLLKDGFGPSQIDEAKQCIQNLFEESSKRVFADVLGRRVPSRFFVDFVLEENKKEDNWHVFARFASMKSREDLLYFHVNKPFVLSVLNTNDGTEVQSTVYHELIHAADLKMLMQNRKIISLNQYNCHKDISRPGKREHSDAWIALLDTIRVFKHLRDEGVAILGERLLTKIPFGRVADTIKLFCWIYGMTLLKSKRWSQNEKELGSVYDDTVHRVTYKIAPSIMVLVLAKRGDIKKDLASRVLEGLETGHYNLNDEEVSSIIKATLSLSFSDYIQAVTNLGGKIDTVQPFLEFCDSVQSKIMEEDTITTEDKSAFAKLFEQPKTAKIYWEVMEQIIDSALPEAKIDDLYQKFKNKRANYTFHQRLKEKVETLYSVLKNDADSEKKAIAQLALTYLFDQKDIIHDNLEGIGLVDDVTVIDYALKILNEKK